MGFRTRFEFNHDLTGQIEDHPEEFIRALVGYLNSGFIEDSVPLERFGVHREAMRHNTEDWPATGSGPTNPAAKGDSDG